jgi:3-deoxy-D-manno-octulosonate 8-phosphate phosphatase (KDO 8-P phosphatase)
MKMRIQSDDAYERAKKVKLVVFDVDGVMTDGRIVLDENGTESKFFNVRDGHGIKMLVRAGVQAAIITGRSSKVVEYRGKELGIQYIRQGTLNKAETMGLLLKETGVWPEEAAFMGDDLVDIPAMNLAGLAAAPSDAVSEIIECSHVITDLPGGKGAVRELCEFILKAKGQWEEIVKRYK